MAFATSTILAVAALAVSAGGAYVQYQQGKEQSSAQRAQNALNERRANLEANRKKRQLYRQQQVTRAQALATGTNQGGAGSSPLIGSLGDIANSGSYNVAGVNQGQEFSSQNAGINDRIGSAASGVATGQGLSSLGNAFLTNYQTISRVIS